MIQEKQFQIIRQYELQDELVYEAIVVTNEVDRYKSIIMPKGMITDPSLVTVDYNHNMVNTGAFLNNFRIEKDVEIIDNANDGLIRTIDEALLVNVVVPKTARKYIRKTLTDSKGRKFETNEIIDQGSVYESLLNGEIKSVSIDATALERYFEDGVEIIPKWDLKRLSLLDETPGQPTARLKWLRADDEDQKIYLVTELDSQIDNKYNTSNNSNSTMNDENNNTNLEEVLTEEEKKVETTEVETTEVEATQVIPESEEVEVVEEAKEEVSESENVEAEETKEEVKEESDIQRGMDYMKRMDSIEETVRACDKRIKRLEDKLEMSYEDNKKMKRALEDLESKQADEDANILRRLEELDSSIPEKVQSNLKRNLQFEEKQETLSKEELAYNRSILANRNNL